MLSHWEKLTGGACNANLPDKPRRVQTARQVKDAVRAEQQRNPSELKFARIAGLRAVGATKDIRKMADTWHRRGGKNVAGFWKQPRD